MNFKKIALGFAATATFLTAAIPAYIATVPKLLNDETRGLTENEIRFAQKIFGDEIDYSAVTLHKGMSGLKELAFGVDDPGAITMGNDVYYDPDLYVDDGAIVDHQFWDKDVKLLAHELEHVHQYQTMKWSFNPVTFFTEHDGKYGNLYEHSFSGKPFEQLNHEQQAVVVEDYAQYLYAFEHYVHNADRDTTLEQRLDRTGDMIEWTENAQNDAKIIGKELSLPSRSSFYPRIDSLQSIPAVTKFFDENKSITKAPEFSKPVFSTVSYKKT